MGKGGGLAAKSFDRVSHFIGAAYDQVATCECEKGCDSCAVLPQSPHITRSDVEVFIIRYLGPVLPGAQRSIV